MDDIGSFFQFLPINELPIENLDIESFKLWLEGMDDKANTALCVNRAGRASLWYRIITEAYG
jgi:hypothetical protein